VNNKQFSLQEIVKEINGELSGDSEITINGVQSLADAQEGDISFLGNKKYTHQVTSTKASAVIVGKDFNAADAGNCSLIICEHPNTSFATVIGMFAPPEIEFAPGIHPAAAVAESAKIGEGTHIGACAVIGEHVVIGKNSVIESGTVISNETQIGDNCMIYANVSIRERCILGNRIIIHPGTVIGSDGFGFEAGPSGIVKIPQVGIVQIDDDVEIGSNCTIDRARFGKTWLKTGVKLDNLVHVAHNVLVGEFSMLIGQSGVAGSAKIGRGVIIAAKAGINGHISIGDGAQVAGTSGVVKDVPPGAKVAGTPAESRRDIMTRIMLPKTVAKMKEKIKDLEQQIKLISD